MKRLLFVVFCILCCSIGSCQNNAKIMEKFKEKLMQTNKHYPKDKIRYYFQHTYKGGCRVEYRLNDYVFYNDFDEGAITGSTPLNDAIFKSGKQKMKITLYPEDGKQTLDKFTRFSIELAVYKDMNSDPNEGTFLKYELPQKIVEQNLPMYVIELEFNAEVPYDYSYMLDGARDLSKEKDIEGKVLRAYTELNQMLERGNLEDYCNAAFNQYVRLYNCSFFPEQTEDDLQDTAEAFGIPDKKMWKINPEECEIIWQCNNRVVSMVRRKDRRDLMGFDYIDKEDGLKTTQSFGIDLYIPEGSDSLQLF